MKRLAFNLAAAASLALCAAMTVLWIDSYDARVDWIYSAWPGRGSGDRLNLITLTGIQGRIWIVWSTTVFHDTALRNGLHSASPPGFHHKKVELSPLRRLNVNVDMRGWWRFRSHRIQNKLVDSLTREAMAPAWLVLAMTLIFPAAWLSVFVNQRRRKTENLCLACGYNLTGNTSGVCPECGVPTRRAALAEDMGIDRR